MGFSKHVSEKALFLTQAKTIQPALDWLEEHKNDPDYNEQLFIQNPPENLAKKSKQQPELSKEEA